MSRNPYDVALENIQWRYDNGQLSAAQYQQMAENFRAKGGRLPNEPHTAQPPPRSFIDPAAIPLIVAEPKPKTAEQIASERAAMSPGDLLNDYLSNHSTK